MRDVEALNTLLIGILDISSAIGEVFTKVVIPPIRSAIEAFSSLKGMTGKTGFTGGDLESFGSGSMTVAGTDVQAMKAAADEYIAKIREAQEIIDRWSAGGGAGKFLGMFQILNAEFDVSRYTAGLESIQKHLKAQGQDTQELERFINSLKSTTESYAQDGASAAASATEEFSFKANSAAVSAEELEKRIKDLKDQFKALESAQLSASGAIGKNLESAKFNKMALDKGWDSGRTGIEKQRQEELRYMSRFQDESKKAGMSPRETEAYRQQMEENSKLAYEISLSNKAREDALREAKKAESSREPVVFDGADRQMESYKRAIIDTFGEITAQSRDNAEEMKRNSGAFYDAERIRIQGWVDDTKRAFRDRVDSIGASIKDMWDSISEAQGRGDIIPPETYASVQELQKMLDSLKEQVPTANKEIEESAQIHLEQFKKMSSIQGELDLAQVNVSYAELTKTMQDQYQAQVALINATEAETLANTNKDIPGLVEAYKALYEEQRRISMLKATGSYFEGMTEGAREIQNSIPTAFENGITAVNAFHDALNSASDAFVELAFTGKASFGDMVNSILKDLAKLAMRQATQGFFSSIVGGIAGWAGSLFGGGRASGGSVSPYTSYLVGERGPELLTMGASGGFITPNGASGGNVSVPVQMTVNLVSNGGSSDPSQGQQIGEAAAKAFRAEVIRIIQDQTRPGNTLNRGLRG
jgi:lambda family phage tail tape measure protein